MNITAKKSLILAKLVGWKITKGSALFWVDDENNNEVFKVSKGDGLDLDDLYSPVKMTAAWRVLNWAMNHPMNTPDDYQFVAQFSLNTNFSEIARLPPQDAQAMWLDAILDLAIKLGKTNQDDERDGVYPVEQGE